MGYIASDREKKDIEKYRHMPCTFHNCKRKSIGRFRKYSEGGKLKVMAACKDHLDKLKDVIEDEGGVLVANNLEDNTNTVYLKKDGRFEKVEQDNTKREESQ